MTPSSKQPETGAEPAKGPTLRISRFIVMAVLQAARARALGLSEVSAHSWGLNRAIFIAAAKQGFRAPGGQSGASRAESSERPVFALGDDEAYRDPDSKVLLFKIGEETQGEAQFHKQVAARFGSEANFQRVWHEALDVVRGFDEATLKSRRDFYDLVYRPRRDELATKWTDEFVPTASKTAPGPRKGG